MEGDHQRHVRGHGLRGGEHAHAGGKVRQGGTRGDVACQVRGGVRQQQADSNTNVVANRNSVLLSNISKQLNNIGQQNVLLNKSLEVISSNLTASSLLDRQRDAANAARERQLAEQGFRSSKEGAIESKIQEALLAPVKKISAVTKLTLGKLTAVFGILVGGWLIDNVFDLLKVNAEGNIEKIEEIKSNILKGLAIAGGV